ncbi:uncharacterized protein LACBIDRAFT_331681 [Laccaria bicolor S238N-H82]|uniref:Predicted protein n=1 Tax=Laccaria bicolor (strain S238N-H82 / ATCC MYA-4686) TaxID=486041 RepID=B0DQ85_LACBS|nr:uncharacterized protein LACBIDRAFT_331681 [Laccaria bicolor S238N-H82]EDR03340.1 predicted protein [Laccaria bicolor S238N-H82]|eukprot:XP_001886136.1 predicted protein [Laccaria bicolor S238N-H82]
MRGNTQARGTAITRSGSFSLSTSTSLFISWPTQAPGGIQKTNCLYRVVEGIATVKNHIGRCDCKAGFDSWLEKFPAMSPSPLSFPQEVIDKIVDELEPEDDLPSLLNCSLTSRSFLAASRRVVFNQVTLGTDGDAERGSKDCRGLYAIVSANPWLGSCIKRIIIEESLFSSPDSEKGTRVGWVSREETLPLLLPLLVSLKLLAIRADEHRHKLDWSTLPPRLAAALSQIFLLPSLVKIEFVELTNFPYEVVTSSRYLKGLSLWGTLLKASRRFLEIAQPRVRSQLEFLDITNSALVIPDLIRYLDLSCLKMLRIGFTCPADCFLWSKLADCTSRSLEELDIIQMYPANEQFRIPHELLDFRPFPDLRVFSLDIAFYACESFPNLNVLPILIDQLRKITSDNNLEEFRLLADYSPPPNDIHVVDDDWLPRFCRLPFWQELDSILTHPRFSKLRRVDVSFKRTDETESTSSEFELQMSDEPDPQVDGGSDLQADTEPECDLEAGLHDLRKQIPGLVNKKIVFFEFMEYVA